MPGIAVVRYDVRRLKKVADIFYDDVEDVVLAPLWTYVNVTGQYSVNEQNGRFKGKIGL